VSLTSPEGDVQQYVLRAQTPLRALVLSSGCEVVGAILLVLWGALDLPVVVAVLGGLLLAFGGAVLLAAVLAFGRLAQTVELSRAGITVRTRSRTAQRVWSDITEVKQQGPWLILQTHPEDEDPLAIRNPGGGAARTFTSIVEGVRSRLDADRGYRPFE
jgi:hypothetical protein